MTDVQDIYEDSLFHVPYSCALHYIMYHTTGWPGNLMTRQFCFVRLLARNVNTIAHFSSAQGTSLPNSTLAAPVVSCRHQRYWVESGTGHTIDQEWRDH